jgi:signal peptidase I
LRLQTSTSPLPSPRKIRRYLLLFVAIFIGLAALRSIGFDWDVVPSASMAPTIHPGEHIFVNKLAYGLKFPFTSLHLLTWAQPKRGEVVVFFSPFDGRRLVKRVVGVPGDTVELRSNRLYLEGIPVEPGSPLPESGTSTQSADSKRGAGPSSAPDRFGPITVPAERYFVLGDNREDSIDSRRFGCIERTRITGRVVGTRSSGAPSAR